MYCGALCPPVYVPRTRAQRDISSENFSPVSGGLLASVSMGWFRITLPSFVGVGHECFPAALIFPRGVRTNTPEHFKFHG